MSPYQLPKKQHPWRTWQGKASKDRGLGVKKKKRKKVKVSDGRSIRIFLKGLVDNWDNVEVYTYAYSREGRFFLKELPQFKQAAWIAGILKRNYGYKKEKQN